GFYLPHSERGAVTLTDVAFTEDRINAGQAENRGTLRHRRLGESAAQRHGRLHRIDPTGQQDVDSLVQSGLNERGEGSHHLRGPPHHTAAAGGELIRPPGGHLAYSAQPRRAAGPATQSLR